ncbi:hypothetical protein SAMN05421776_11730 [Nocardia farcinica]|uniref:Transmembrane Fragile-X-F protein n=1 Tax=Nocardia farcinica TaxID=37329 RepID=A0A0H5NXR4_NOCFR|nr:hypothetical protein [Nocardia farcinica]AXK86558.1 hypothetical protein DXT66_13810 [Nocardia farcinica]PFW99037.1 hypothetical protein CJ469_05637 [Nocardia farcinica]PFX06075.1 hypothetical protein CJ468_04935 [Nocardia farcinica]CRY79834.1 Uncharacterised protein [Nocardia farcinica]SIT33596.1 hypothetical protein SAMN05421776_11730 [Nocardia farcinica]
MESSNAGSGGVGFSGALFLVFLVLKLTGVIAWSWWWITAPLWIPFLLVVVSLVILFFIATIAND